MKINKNKSNFNDDYMNQQTLSSYSHKYQILHSQHHIKKQTNINSDVHSNSNNNKNSRNSNIKSQANILMNDKNNYNQTHQVNRNDNDISFLSYAIIKHKDTFNINKLNNSHYFDEQQKFIKKSSSSSNTLTFSKALMTKQTGKSQQNKQNKQNDPNKYNIQKQTSNNQKQIKTRPIGSNNYEINKSKDSKISHENLKKRNQKQNLNDHSNHSTESIKKKKSSQKGLTLTTTSFYQMKQKQCKPQFHSIRSKIQDKSMNLNHSNILLTDERNSHNANNSSFRLSSKNTKNNSKSNKSKLSTNSINKLKNANNQEKSKNKQNISSTENIKNQQKKHLNNLKVKIDAEKSKKIIINKNQNGIYYDGLYKNKTLSQYPLLSPKSPSSLQAKSKFNLSLSRKQFVQQLEKNSKNITKKQNINSISQLQRNVRQFQLQQRQNQQNYKIGCSLSEVCQQNKFQILQQKYIQKTSRQTLDQKSGKIIKIIQNAPDSQTPKNKIQVIKSKQSPLRSCLNQKNIQSKLEVAQFFSCEQKAQLQLNQNRQYKLTTNQKNIQKLEQRKKQDELANQKIINRKKISVQDFIILSEEKKNCQFFGVKKFKALYKPLGFLCSLSIVEIKSKPQDHLFKEQFIQSLLLRVKNNLKYPNIVQLYHIFSDQKCLYLLQEYVHEKQCKNQKNLITIFQQKEACFIFKQVLDACSYLHSEQIVHRAIKLQGLKFSYFQVCKLSNLEWIVKLQKSKNRQTFCGELDLAPPELINNMSYDQSIDIWQLGVLLYKLLTGKHPFSQKIQTTSKSNSQQEFDQKTIKNISLINIKFSKNLTNQAIDLLGQIFEQKQKRISLENIIKHPLMSKYEYDFSVSKEIWNFCK